MARTHTVTRFGGTGPAGSSTTNEAVPGKRWFCQFDAVPNGHSMLWYGYLSNAEMLFHVLSQIDADDDESKKNAALKAAAFFSCAVCGQ